MYFGYRNLLASAPDKDTDENVLLFTLEWLLLREMVTDKSKFDFKYEDVKLSFEMAVLQSRTKDGFLAYPDSKKYMAFGDQLASHDNLTAISCGSYLYDIRDYHKEVWKMILQNGFKRPSYDESGKLIFCLMHPRDIIFYGMLNKNYLCWALYPLFVLITLYSFLGDKCSGKLLAFVRMKTLKLNLLYNVCTLMLKFTKLKNWKGVFSNYFLDQLHPSNIEAEKAFKD